MNRLFCLDGALLHDPAVDAWLDQPSGELGLLARHWFEVIRACGEDVREVLHDGHPTACVSTAAFAYVNSFKAHVNVGFFHGAELPDPRKLLQGTGKLMRHVKLQPSRLPHEKDLEKLIQAAYVDIKRRLAAN